LCNALPAVFPRHGGRAIVAGTDTRILYRGDDLAGLASKAAQSVDLVYLEFLSDRVHEVIWGGEAKVRSFEDRWEGGIRHDVGWMRERVEQLPRVPDPTGSL